MTRTRHFLVRSPPRAGPGSGALGPQPPVVVSYSDGCASEDVFSLAGHLKVSTERTFHLDVPHHITDECEGRFKPMNNPHNQTGPLLAEQVPVVTGSDFESFMAAFNKRCNTVHASDLEDAEFNAAYDLLESLKPLDFGPWDDNDLDRSRWLAKFDAPKRARMTAAMLTVPDCSSKYLGTKDLSVKHETLLKRNDPSWAPRVIYAGNDAFNAVTGPAAMIAMERLEVVFGTRKFNGIEFMTAYKKTDVQLASFISEDADLQHHCEGDYSANDKEQRFRVHVLFDKFLEVINMPTWFRELNKKLNTFRVQSRAFGLQATLENQLPTGTTNTTVRNTIYNALMFAVSMRQQSVKRGRALVLGDDLLAATISPVDLSLWQQCVARFKMVLKAKAPKINGQATFLSRRLLVEREEPCMVPLIGKALARFNSRALYREDKTHSQYMAGKSLSYAYEFRHVPFLRDFFLLRFTMEDRSRLSLDDLTWTAKTSGIDLDNIVATIKAESVLVSDDEFLDWLMLNYDLGLVDLEEICELVILSDEPEMIEHHTISKLSIDW